MRYDVVTIFPEYLEPLKLSLLGKAREKGLVDLHLHDLREHTFDRHRTVDDTPYGGGAGMVMKAEPWGLALDEVLAASPLNVTEDAPEGAKSEGTGPEADTRPLLIVPSPAGAVFDQAMAYKLAEEKHIVFAPARYEGIDERVLDWAEVLLSGNHGAIARWRRDRQIERTLERRPDLLEAYPVEQWDKKDRRFLAERGVHFANPAKAAQKKAKKNPAPQADGVAQTDIVAQTAQTDTVQTQPES